MNIQKIIVQDSKRTCILNNPIAPTCTLEELEKQLKIAGVHYYNIDIDYLGVALVTTCKALSRG